MGFRPQPRAVVSVTRWRGEWMPCGATFGFARTNGSKPATRTSAAAVLLFLLGCVNVSGLSVARAGRAPEVAVRTALGAELRHLMRQHVVEGLLYGLRGGVAGLNVATAAIPDLYALIPVDLPAWMQFRLDHRIIAFAPSGSVGIRLVISTTSLA